MTSNKLDKVLTELLIHPQLDHESEEYILDIISSVGQINILPMDGTHLICSICSAVNALGYRLKRSGGKYVALCINEFGGCAGKDINPQCSYTDDVGVQCSQLAEFQIAYGSDKLLTRYACIIHGGRPNERYREYSNSGEVI